MQHNEPENIKFVTNEKKKIPWSVMFLSSPF